MIILLFLAWLCFLVLALQMIKPDLKRRYQAKKPKSKYHRRQNSYLAKATKTKSPGYSGAWHQLLKLIAFDVELAERLVSQCQRRHPEKSDRWCVEKVIWDLERDRSL